MVYVHPARLARRLVVDVSAAVFAVAMVGLAQLAPVVLLPIFYKFKPLDRPALVERLMALAARRAHHVDRRVRVGAERHTKKANAALAGLGRTRRILLSDTLLADYSDDEIEVMLAHELAHHVHRDLWRGIAVQTLALFGGFFVASLIAARRWPIRSGCAACPIRPACRCCCWSAARGRSC